MDRLQRARLWSYRTLAVCVALTPFLLIEILLRGIDWPRHHARDDPFVDLHALRPLFSLSADNRKREIAEVRRNWFDYDSFPIDKPPGTRRCFVLGGSTVQGEPYRIASAYSTWLELYLNTANDAEAWDVINCGGVSYASYRLSMILDEVLQYEPDLIILDCGHNEFLEHRTYASWSAVPKPIAQGLGYLSTLRTVQAGRILCFGQQASRQATKLPAEVDALLDHPHGLEAYHRNDIQRDAVIEHFRITVAQMLLRCQRAQVPIVVCLPMSNLLDSPPFKIEVDPQLTEAQRTSFETHWLEACNDELSLEARKLQCEQCLNIDPHHAGAAYLLGRIEIEAGHYTEAKHWLTVARDWDVCPLRITSEMEQHLRDVTRHTKTETLDCATLFAEQSPHGIQGGKLFIDHVHPTIVGHQLVAKALAEKLEQMNFVHSAPGWNERSTAAVLKHLSTLDEAYYHHGQQRLEGLQRWAQGRGRQIHAP